MISNLEFLIELRHEIEHRSTSRIDDAVSSQLQACCINFNDIIKTHFGPQYGLDGVTGRRQPSWECGRPLHGDMNVKNFYLMELSSYCERNRRSEGSSP
jgi:uncharacterized protein DUF3644